MNDPKKYQLNLPSIGRPDDVVLNEVWYPGIKDFWDDCTSERSVDRILGIKAIVIHATAGSSSSGAVSVMVDGKASFHWLVPDENEDQHGQLVWACAPETRAAWHVRNSCSHPDVNGGAKKVNHWSLGIEIVNSQINDPFSDWQVEATARIVRYCWAKYPNLVHVVSHAKLDPDRRKDPGISFPWDRFKDLVLNGANDGVPTTVANAPHASMLLSRMDTDACCMSVSGVEILPTPADDRAALLDQEVAEFNRFIKAPDDRTIGREDILRMLAYREREEFFISAASSMAAITSAATLLPKPDVLVAKLSSESREAIVGYETGGKSYYNNVIKERPIWPGGASGVTIGFGYDLGYNSKSDFKSNWQLHLSASDFAALAGAIGLTGNAAKAAIRGVDHIRIPWGVGLSVFDVTTLPKFTYLTFERLPNLFDLSKAGLHGHCLGVLVSLVFNRGASFNKPGDRYREMRAIREAIEQGTTTSLSKIPQYLRDMKRLWVKQGLGGLLARRETEAVLFERGLSVTPRLPIAALPPLAPAIAAATVAPITLSSVLRIAKQDEEAPELFEALESLSQDERDRLLVEPGVDDGEDTVEPQPSIAITAARRFSKSDVVWVRDDRNHPDYRHLPPDAAGSTFSFTPQDLERMIKANHFDPQTGSHGKIIFALRGAILVGSGNSQENSTSLSLKDVRPDHKAFRCVIGIYDRTKKRLSGYTASTVPNAGGVLAQYNGTENANLLPTGCYELCVGTHFGSVTVKGVLRLGNGPVPANAGQATVLRTKNDVTYGNQNTWDNCKPADNIHPAFGTTAFSSLGCLTVMGSYRGSAGHTGEWKKFRDMAELDSGNGPGTRFDLVLLTGLDAATAASMRLAGKSPAEIDAILVGLRHGSKGPKVSALQSALGLTPDDEFGPGTKLALAKAQLEKLGFATGVYSVEMDGDMGLGIF